MGAGRKVVVGERWSEAPFDRREEGRGLGREKAAAALQTFDLKWSQKRK